MIMGGGGGGGELFREMAVRVVFRILQHSTLFISSRSIFLLTDMYSVCCSEVF